MSEEVLEARVRRALIGRPHVRSVELVGSRATGTPTPLSDWDFVIGTDDYEAVARDLPTAVAELEPIARQWDRISDYPCYMLMLRGPAKVDLIFPGEPYTSLPPWTVSARTLDGIDQHVWDWLLWLASKAEKGEDELVERELVKMFDHLLGPMGADGVPGSLPEAAETYGRLRDRREREFAVRVTRVREREVLPVLANA
jgi:nucleotidyltransferase-like protein